MKFYRGSAAAARSYVEADRSRADDYYLAEGTGLAARYIASPAADGGFAGPHGTLVMPSGSMDGPTYETWVAGFHVETGNPKGRLRTDDRALRFVEVVVNGPKTWSLAASLHPEIAEAFDAAQDRAAGEIIGWLAEHATTRVGPRGRQVQVPVDRLEAAVVRHYTSRAGDPHRHLHLQVNARVLAADRWRGLHSVGVVHSIEAMNGIGHAAVMCDPVFRNVLAGHGYTLDLETGDITQLAPYVGAFSARAAQIAGHVDRYEAQWRQEHPGTEPGPKLRRVWDRRAWAESRPDKVVPESGAALVDRWNRDLYDLGFQPPQTPVRLTPTAIGRIRRDVAVELIVTRLGARRSAWNAADIRGEAEKLIASVGVIAERPARVELTEDLTSRAVAASRPLLDTVGVPEHVRSLTSHTVLTVEAELVASLAERGNRPVSPATRVRRIDQLDPAQQHVVAALAGSAGLLVIEGAAGAGKTTTLAAARGALQAQDRRLVVVTPTLKAAQAATQELGVDAFSAAWLIYQHGYRWDDDGHWSHHQTQRTEIHAFARLLPGDVLLVDEAGMLDQDTARALFAIADQAQATLVLLGDRHQLPAVGRGGVLDLAARWVHPSAHLELESVHRFTDTTYADLTVLMRTGERSGEVFDALLARGEVVVHATAVERTQALAALGATGNHLVIADTREEVATLNRAISDQRNPSGAGGGEPAGEPCGEGSGEPVTSRGEQIRLGDRVATRRNDRHLGVANRDTWTVAGIGEDASLLVTGPAGMRELPAGYVKDHVELAYATTVYGAQGDTVDSAHLVIGETTGGGAAYVGMTRGRHHNVAHLVADNPDDARQQWVDTFNRDRADLGPAHAATLATADIDRYGVQAPAGSTILQAAALRRGFQPRPEMPPTPQPTPSPGIGR